MGPDYQDYSMAGPAQQSAAANSAISTPTSTLGLICLNYFEYCWNGLKFGSCVEIDCPIDPRTRPEHHHCHISRGPPFASSRCTSAHTRQDGSPELSLHSLWVFHQESSLCCRLAVLCRPASSSSGADLAMQRCQPSVAWLGPGRHQHSLALVVAKVHYRGPACRGLVLPATCHTDWTIKDSFAESFYDGTIPSTLLKVAKGHRCEAPNQAV